MTGYRRPTSRLSSGDVSWRQAARGRPARPCAWLRRNRRRRGGCPSPIQIGEAWIDYLEAAEEADAAQAVRWAAFERTLSRERARPFISRLADFDDVEAETKAFGIAAGHADFEKGLRFLTDRPAPADASRMIEARSDDIQVDPDLAELWAAKRRRRFPKAAHYVLRKAAAATATTWDNCRRSLKSFPGTSPSQSDMGLKRRQAFPAERSGRNQGPGVT
jgi:hypothetical protein